MGRQSCGPTNPPPPLTTPYISRVPQSLVGGLRVAGSYLATRTLGGNVPQGPSFKTKKQPCP